jgi:hypothetical protein
MKSKSLTPIRAMLAVAGVVALTVLPACVSPQTPPDHGKSWRREVRKDMGTRFSVWRESQRAVEQQTLPLRFPSWWTEDDWRSRYLQYAKKFGGEHKWNYLYERRAEGWVFRGDKYVSSSAWQRRFGDEDALIRWLDRLRADLPVDGQIQGHFFLVWRGRDFLTYWEDYLVVFTTNDTIVGYSPVSWGFGKGELDYIADAFGFIP